MKAFKMNQRAHVMPMSPASEAPALERFKSHHEVIHADVNDGKEEPMWLRGFLNGDAVSPTLWKEMKRDKIVRCVQFGKNRKGEPVLLAGGQDNSVVLINLVTHEIGFDIPREKDIHAMTISPDGTKVAVGSAHSDIWIIDMETGEVLHKYDGKDEVLCLVYSNDGRYLAGGGKSETVFVMDVTNGLIVFEIARSDAVLTVCFSSDDKHLISAGKDNMITVMDWRIASTSASSPTGGKQSILGAGGADEDVDGTGSRKFVAEFRRSSRVNEIVVSKDGKIAAAVDQAGTIVIIDLVTMTIAKKIRRSMALDCVSFSPDAKYVVCGGDDSKVSIIEIESGEVVRAFPRKGHIHSVAWSDDGKYIATGGNDSKISYMECGFYNPLRIVNEFERPGTILALAISSNNHYLACGGKDKILCVMDITDSENTKTKDIPLTSRINAIVFSSDNTFLAVGDDNGEVVIVSLTTEPIAIIKRFPRGGPVNALSLSPDGRYLGIGREKGVEVEILDLKADGKVIMETDRKGGVTSTAFSSDGKYFAAGGSDNHVIITDMTTMKPISKQIDKQARVHCLTFNNSNSLLAIGYGDTNFCLINTDTWETKNELVFNSCIFSLSFSADDQYLATNGCIYDIEKRMVLQDARPYTKMKVRDMMYSQDGKFLIIACDSKLVHVEVGPVMRFDFLPFGLIEENPEKYFSGLSAMNQVQILTSRCTFSEESFLFLAIERNMSKTVQYCLRVRPGTLLVRGVSSDFEKALEVKNQDIVAAILSAAISPEVTGSINYYKFVEQFIQFMGDCTELFPDIVISTLDSIKLIPTTDRTELTTQRKVSNDTTIQRGHVHDLVGTLWDDYASYSSKDGVPTSMTSLRTPIPGLGSSAFLDALSWNCSEEVVKTEVISIIMDVLWREHMRKYFMIDFILFITMFFTWMVYIDALSVVPGVPRSEIVSTLTIIYILNSLFLLKEIRQIYIRCHASYGPGSTYFDIWNFVDWLSIIMIYITIITNDIPSMGFASHRSIIVVATIFMSLKAMSYLRALDLTGWIVNLLIQNVHDSRGFITFLAFVILCVGLQFRVLLGSDSCVDTLAVDDFQSMSMQCNGTFPVNTLKSWVIAFRATIAGQADLSVLGATADPHLADILFVVYLVVLNVVMLNGYIALLGQSFGNVSPERTKMQRLFVIMEYYSLIPESGRKRIQEKCKYYHVLVPTMKFQGLANQAAAQAASMSGASSASGSSSVPIEAPSVTVVDENSLKLQAEVQAMKERLVSMELLMTKVATKLLAGGESTSDVSSTLMTDKTKLAKHTEGTTASVASHLASHSPASHEAGGAAALPPLKARGPIT